jgi:ABC-type uncharacterized transport system involved in gliding motility auxiliary subunit
MKLTSPNWNALRKYAKYLFWLAPVLLIMGLTAGVIAGWGAVPTALMVAGFALLVVWLLATGYAQPNFWQRRSTQAGTNALIATLAVLAILGFVNFLAARYTSRVDLTENQIFTLAPQSQEVLRDLNQPVKAWVFTPTANPADRQLLENYRRETEQFSYEFVDPQAKPGIAREFEVQSIGEMYLEAGDRRRFVQSVTPEERLSERKLTNSLAQVTNSEPQKVYFLQGHGERPLESGQGAFSQVKSRLGEESFTAEPLNLATNPKIPEDANVVISAGAQRPLLDVEVNALKDYLKRKSGLMLLIDPQTDPNLNSLLQEWGVTVSDRLVTDPAGESSGLGAGVVIVNQYGDHPITRGFNSGISFYPLVRPLQIQPVTGVQVTPLLITADRTQAQQIAASGDVQSNPTDPNGPFDIGAALSRTVATPTAKQPQPSPSPDQSPAQSPATQSPSPSGNPASPSPAADAADPNAADADQAPEARLVVIGSSSFATDGLFDQQLNGDVFLNSVSWLSQQDDQVLSIRPKEVTNRRIVLSGPQQLSAVLLALVLLPLLGFSTAALTWWRRR